MKSLFRSVVGGLCAAWAWPVWGQERPNIVLFVVDDMGVMDTSVPFLTDSLGQPQAYPLNRWYRTPHMEELAERGIRFSTFYAQNVSSPSRASLLTGLNGARHRTTNWIHPTFNNRDTYGPPAWNWDGLRPTDHTLPRLLGAAGYRTIHVGKAHFGHQESSAADPCSIGFDVNVAGAAIGEPGSYLGEHAYGLWKGSKAHAVPGLDRYHGSSTFLTEALTEEALKQIDQASAQGKPFFLHLAHYAVHAPFEADSRFLAHYTDSTRSAAAVAFATLIEGMDHSLGRLMAHLEERGMAEHTLIVFLGDNGGDAPLGHTRGYGSSAPLRGKKGAEFEGGIRVPCIVSWAKPNPQNRWQQALPIASGGVQTQLATLMDIFPTLARVGGVDASQASTPDGADLGRLLQGAADPRRNDEMLVHFPHQHRGSYYTVFRQGVWKLIYYYNPEHPERPDWALYQLDDDPFEEREVSRLYPQQALSMLRTLMTKLDEQEALYPVDVDGREVRPNLAYFENLIANSNQH